MQAPVLQQRKGCRVVWQLQQLLPADGSITGKMGVWTGNSRWTQETYDQSVLLQPEGSAARTKPACSASHQMSLL